MAAGNVWLRAASGPFRLATGSREQLQLRERLLRASQPPPSIQARRHRLNCISCSLRTYARASQLEEKPLGSEDRNVDAFSLRNRHRQRD